MEERWAGALLNPEVPIPTGLTSWNGSDPQQRFNVYRNNVLVSLMEAMAQTFPVVRELVGEEFFDATAREYVRARPPRSAVLANYGSDFDDFLRDFLPVQGLPYLPDMAQLELQYLKAMHAADAEPLDAQLLAELLSDPEQLATLRVQLHPSLRCLRSQYGVFSIWAAHRGDLEIDRVNPEIAECGWILREKLEVRLVPSCRGDCDFVEALNSGEMLGVAAQLAAEDEVFDLPRCLTELLSRGMLVFVDGIETAENPPVSMPDCY